MRFPVEMIQCLMGPHLIFDDLVMGHLDHAQVAPLCF